MRRTTTLVALTTILACCSLWAKPLAVSVKLKQAEAQTTSEKSGDELYFSITEYSSLRDAKLLRVPMHPSYWLSKHISKLHNVPLWEALVEDGEGVELILTLVERDAPPWNIDDHIGSVKLKIRNMNGKLETHWSIADLIDQPEIIETGSQEQPKYILTGDHSRYQVAFDIEQTEQS